MYVADKFKLNIADEMSIFVKKFDQVNPVWSDILTIDYFYHNHMPNYDGGLSFFDRLDKKIGRFHENWDIEGFKRIIRGSNNPVSVYEDIVKYMLEDPNDINYYGV